MRLVERVAERESGVEGVVEVCIAGRWSTVACTSGWQYEEAQVVCRQLGYGTIGKVISHGKIKDMIMCHTTYSKVQ